MKYYKNGKIKVRYGKEGCFIKINGKERRTTEKDATMGASTITEGDEITKEEYGKNS